MQIQTCAWRRSSERATRDLGSNISTRQVRFPSCLSTMSEPTDGASPSMMWKPEEMPGSTHFRELSAQHGDQSLQKSNLCPIEHHQEAIHSAFQENAVTAVRAEPGSGMTTQLVEMLLNVLNPKEPAEPCPVVLVLRTALAALEIVKSLIGLSRWTPETIHLRTGQHPREQFLHGNIPLTFTHGTTRLTVTTYGILWR